MMTIAILIIIANQERRISDLIKASTLFSSFNEFFIHILVHTCISWIRLLLEYDFPLSFDIPVGMVSYTYRRA